MFEQSFQFHKGGKLPGLCETSSRPFIIVAHSAQDGGDAGEMYTYLPQSFSANQALCHIPPYSMSNPTYSTSVGRGSFSFQPGEWTTVMQRMRLNDASQENGELELFVNGQSMINISGLVLHSSEAGRIRGMQIQTFFGGGFSFPCIADR
jgi:polysaccharide lyase-like protein